MLHQQRQLRDIETRIVHRVGGIGVSASVEVVEEEAVVVCCEGGSYVFVDYGGDGEAVD